MIPARIGPLTGGRRLVDEGVTAIASIFDDCLGHRPVREIFVLSFFLGFDNVTGEVASDMFHALIPAELAFEDSATEAAGASLRGLPPLHPAPIPHVFEAVLEDSPFLGIGIVGEERDRTWTRLGLVHTSMMLSEEILAIEVVVDSFVAGHTRI